MFVNRVVVTFTARRQISGYTWLFSRLYLTFSVAYGDFLRPVCP